MAGRPKPAFFIVLVLVVLGLVGYAMNRMGLLAPKGTEGQTGVIDKGELDKLKGKVGGATSKQGVEAADEKAPTTVKEYTFVSGAKLPPVKGVSSYAPLKGNTIRVALNVWAGWAPIIFANQGLAPGKVWEAGPGGKPFKVELVLIDDPVVMRDAYSTGKIHIGWATVDMLPLFMEEFRKDSRLMPRVYQQIDWSNGGDGIVSRGVGSINELRGKTIALAQNSPSEFFLLNALINAGIQPSEVKMKYTADAFQAAAAFNNDKSISACVSWAPDIYNLAKVKGNKLIVSTATANKIIADVWFARADVAKDHAALMEGLVRGIFDAMEALKSSANKQQAAELMAKAYNLPPSEALQMLGDAHSTNYAENRDFFLNQNNPTNFERTWDTAYYLYKRMGRVSEKTSFDQVVDFSVIQKLGAIPKYANQKNEYEVQFTPKSVTAIRAESGEILTKTVVIHFFPNSFEIDKKINRIVGGRTTEELYDPNVPLVLEEIGRLSGQYGASRIIIEGHSDSSMKGMVPFQGVQELSLNRANAVKEALIRKFNSLQPNQFSAAGLGWNRPADPNDPGNHAKNRRVEIKVYPLEAQ